MTEQKFTELMKMAVVKELFDQLTEALNGEDLRKMPLDDRWELQHWVMKNILVAAFNKLRSDKGQKELMGFCKRYSIAIEETTNDLEKQLEKANGHNN